MLDPWIIEEIRRREEDQRQREQQRSQFEIHEMPSETDRNERRSGRPEPAPASDRGVVVIDFSV